MEYNAVRAARAGFGYTQTEMANALGVTNRTYWNKENGKTKFSDREKSILAEMFGWNLVQINSYLYDGALPIRK